MRSTNMTCLVAVGCAAAGVACSAEAATSEVDAGPAISLGDAGVFDAARVDAAADKREVDGGYAGLDGSVFRADRFITTVVRATYGDCAGFGLPSMPSVVLGPPAGAGALAGSLDVVSLGFRGEVVVSFEPNAAVDGPGSDFIVFENAFWAGGDPARPAAELGEVSVSEDGLTWKTFPCAPGPGPSFGSCAGWRPVFASPDNGISALDPQVAGGDPFDLADVGLTRARFVRIRDLGTVACPSDPASRSTTVGFDLDAVALVHAQTP